VQTVPWFFRLDSKIIQQNALFKKSTLRINNTAALALTLVSRRLEIPERNNNKLQFKNEGIFLYGLFTRNVKT